MLWGLGGLAAAGACFVIFVWIPVGRLADEIGTHLSAALADPTPGSAERKDAALTLLDDFFSNRLPSVLLCADGSGSAFVCGDGQLPGLEVRRLEAPDAELFELRANTRGSGFALLANSVKPVNGVRSGDPRIELWLREDAAAPWRKCTRDREFKSACGWMRSGQGVLYAELPQPDPDERDDAGYALLPRMRILAYDIPTEGIRPYSKLANFDMIYSLSDETEAGVYCEGRIRGRCGIWRVVPAQEPRLEIPFGSAPTLTPDGRTVLCVRACDACTWPAWTSRSVDLIRFSADRTGDSVETVRSAIDLPVRSLVAIGATKVVLVSSAADSTEESERERLRVIELHR